jgi:NADH-quinone oxidoreductase subunit F
MMSVGTMLGTTAVQVFSDQDCPVYATYRWIEFYHHESCGKCTPCREGNYWMKQVLRRILSGQGTHEDLDTLQDACDNLLGRSFCALGDGATSSVTSAIKYFREEFIAGTHTPAWELFPYQRTTRWANESVEEDA